MAPFKAYWIAKCVDHDPLAALRAVPISVPQLPRHRVASPGYGFAVLDMSPPGRGSPGASSPLWIREMCGWPLRFWWLGSHSLDGPVHRRSADAEEFGQLGLGVGA